MWKWFTALAVCLFLVAGAIAGYRYWERQKFEEEQRQFLNILDSGDPKRLQELMDPTLRAVLDPGLIEMWLQVIQARLGAVNGIQVTGRTESKSGGSTEIATEAAVTFARGTGNTRLLYREGKLIGMGLKSPQLGQWLEDMPDTSRYEEAGQKFIRDFFTNQPKEVFAAMDAQTLQKQLPLPQVAKATEIGTAKGGRLLDVQLKNKSFEKVGEKGYPTLRLAYDISSENGKSVGYVTYIFDGLRARLIAFQFQ